MKKTYLYSLFARYLTLLILALLSTNLAWGKDVTDVITQGSFDNVLSSGYNNYTCTGTSGATYLINFYKNGNTFMNFKKTTTSSGLVVTGVPSGKKIKSVTATFGNQLNIYWSNTAYSSSVITINSDETSAVSLTTDKPKSPTSTATTFRLYSPSTAATVSNITIVWEDAASSEPSLSVDPETIDFGTVYQDAKVDAQDVTVTFANLTTNDVAAAISGSAFSIDKTGSFTSGDKITITPNTATLGEYEETLTLSSETDGLEETVTVTMNVVEAPAPTGTFNKFTGDLVEGDYVICDNSDAMKNEVTSKRLAFASVSISENKIVNPDKAVIWHISVDPNNPDYWLMYNEAAEKYAAFTSSNGNADLLDAVTDYARWQYSTVSNNKEFSNKGKTEKYLRKNGTYGFASYSSSTGNALTLYQKVLPPTNEAVTFAAPEGGSLVIKNGETPITSGTTIQNGTVLDVTFGMTPAEAYKDVAIKVTKTEGGDDVTSTVYDATKMQITMPRYAITVAVTFTKLYKISLVTAGDGTGSATMNGKTTDIYVDGDTQIDLVANAVAPNEFTSWSATENIEINEGNKAETYAFASGDGTITATFGISALQPLGTPTLSNPTNITYSGVTLNWEELANAESYNVELLLNDETVASDVITGEISWTPEVTLQANTTYTYTVQGVGDGITYAEDNNPKAQSTVTTADYPAVVLTLSENGITSTIDGKLNTPIDLPTTSTKTYEGKVFMGWSETIIDGVTDTKPSLLGETYTFTNPEQLTATIYAVFAEKNEGDVTWNKVPTNYTDWNGNEFLIVYESEATKGYVMKEADEVSNYVEATIANGVIATKPDDAMSIIIEKYGITTDYQLRVAGGSSAKYLKGKSGNGLSFDASAQQTAISYDNTNGWLISNNSSWLRYNTTSGQTRFRFYKSTTYTQSSYKSVQLYKKTQEITYSNYRTTVTVPVTINKIEGKTEGYATFSCDYALDLDKLPEGLTAYYATYKQGAENLTMKKATGNVEANTGLFLAGEPETSYAIPVAATGTKIDENILEPTTGAELQKGDYVYRKSDGYFYPLGKNFFVSKGKAYIPASKINTEQPVEINFEGTPTGVEEIKSQSTVNGQQSTAVYNLQGMRVATPKKGEVYIMNGKKFLMK